jgi:GR25 family glycosyltransferase involved in LPS biosynthesis
MLLFDMAKSVPSEKPAIDMNVRAFIISLPSAVNRREQVRKIQSICPIASDIIDAVDGRAMHEWEREKYVGKNLFRPYFPFQLRPGEIGHFLSQRKAWQAILDQELDAALLLEDDIEIDLQVFGSGLDLALNAINEVDIIKFRAPTRRRTPLNQGAEQAINTPVVAPLGTTSFLVTNGAAQRLLAVTKRFDRPADALLQLSWVTGIKPRTITPSGVQEVSHLLGGSSIQTKKRTLFETLYRNIARPCYRTKLQCHARLPGLLIKRPAFDTLALPS